MALLALMALAVLLGPWLWTVPINEIDFAAKLKGPSLKHPLGTDDLGQDLLARMLYGGRISLAVGVVSMLIAILVGVVIGAIAGISRGSVDAALMWVTDLFLSLPQLPFLILVIYLFRDSLKALVGPEVGIFVLVVAVIGAFRWMPAARLVRAQFLSLREKEFVEAARALGATDAVILGRHILPHLVSPVIVAFSLDVGTKILATAGLSFLGLGTQPPTADWGSMLATGRQFVILRPHVVLLPGLAIFLIVLALNLVGDALRDLLDPRTRTQ
jgi:peptide/nickel transport system permease protein